MTAHSQDLHPVTIVRFSQPDEEGEVRLELKDDLERTLIMPVGACGAQAIMLALKRVQIDRPLTHELLLTIADELGATVDALVIDDLSKGIFYARLLLTTAEGTLSLDCRPSDGLAIALRANAPLFATDTVMQGEGTDE
jgi:bifunctional DNase/RNase